MYQSQNHELKYLSRQPGYIRQKYIFASVTSTHCRHSVITHRIKNKSLLVGAIDKCTSDKVYLEMFGIADPAISNENNKIV